MQKLTIIGNLVRDPETKDSQNGSMVCTFTVAVNAQIKELEAVYDQLYREDVQRQIDEYQWII